MKIDKVTVSGKQKLVFYTIRGLPEHYLILTAPIGLTVKVADEHNIHIRVPKAYPESEESE